MRKAVLAFAVLLWLAGVASFIYCFAPRNRTEIVVAFVSEMLTKTVKMQIQIGDQTGTVTVPYSYQVFKPVYETKTREPTQEEKLRFYCLSGVASLLFLYCAIILLNFGRCLWIHKPPTKSVEIQLTGLVTFLMGVFGGALTLPITPPRVPELPARGSAGELPQQPFGLQLNDGPSVGPPLVRPRLNPEERVGPPDREVSQP